MIFIGIFVVVLVILIILFLKQNNTHSNNENRIPENKIIKKSQINVSLKTNVSSQLYKEKLVRYFEIKGLNYSNDKNFPIGEFLGFATCVYNSHDQYAVEISTNGGSKLGFVPKGNKRLNESLSAWHNRKILVWGFLRYDEYLEKWFGSVNIPVGFDSDIIQKIETFFNLKILNSKILSNNQIKTLEYFEVIENHEKLTQIYNEIKHIKEIDYNLPHNLFQKFTMKLEKEKDWPNLINLKKYTHLIKELSDNNPNSVNKRIEKAEREMNK